MTRSGAAPDKEASGINANAGMNANARRREARSAAVKSRPPSVALIVDNPLRDLPGLTLLAARLCTYGIDCHMVPMQRQDMEIGSLAPDAVVINYLRPNNEKAVRQFLEAEIAVLISDTEGGILTSLDSYERTLSQDDAVRSGISRYCSWGSSLAEHALTRGWYRSDQVAVTGAPRFDYYSPTWREAALAASPWADQLPSPLVLINGNFPLANPQFQSADAELRMQVAQFGHDPEEIARRQAGQQLVLEELTALVNRLAGRFPDTTFLYRPHPFERLATYETLLTPRPNLFTGKTGTAEGWILRSCAVLQRNCTTAVEAGMAGVPALSPSWIPVPLEVESAEGPSVPCHTEAALEGHLMACIEGRMAMPEANVEALNRTVDAWFFRADGRSHERVAAEVMAALRPHDRLAHRSRCMAIGRATAPPDASRTERVRPAVRALLKRHLPPGAAGLQPSRAERPWRRSEKQFDASDVSRILAPLAGPMGIPDNALEVESAQRAGSYLSRLPFGRAVTIKKV